MDKQTDIGLGNIEFPSTEIDVEKPPERSDLGTVNYDDQVTYNEVIETDPNQMLVEGVAELKDHPQLESFLMGLNDLKNEFILKVEGLSKDFELRGSVKVLFTVSKKDS